MISLNGRILVTCSCYVHKRAEEFWQTTRTGIVMWKRPKLEDAKVFNQKISARVKISVVDIVTDAIFGMEVLVFLCLLINN